MLIPMLWSAIVALFTGAAVYYHCAEANEYEAGFYISVIAIAWMFVAMVLCLAVGM